MSSNQHSLSDSQLFRSRQNETHDKTPDPRYQVIKTFSGPAAHAGIIGEWAHQNILAPNSPTREKISAGIVATLVMGAVLAAGQMAMPKLDVPLSLLMAGELDPSVLAKAKQPEPAIPIHATERTALAALISDKWDVEQAAADKIVASAVHAGDANRVDPLLVLAVIAQESDFVHRGNPGRRTILGHPGSIDPAKPHGLMQVNGRIFANKFPGGKTQLTTDATNIRIGTSVLRDELDATHGNVVSALQRYNGNTEDVDSRYAGRVLEYQATFRKTALEAARVQEAKAAAAKPAQPDPAPTLVAMSRRP